MGSRYAMFITVPAAVVVLTMALWLVVLLRLIPSFPDVMVLPFGRELRLPVAARFMSEAAYVPLMDTPQRRRDRQRYIEQVPFRSVPRLCSVVPPCPSGAPRRGLRAPHGRCGQGRDALEGGGAPCVTFRLVVVSLRGPGQSPVLPFACCAGSLRSVGRCGRCSCWCRCRVRGAQWLVCWGCAGCGRICRLHVSGAQ